MHNANKPTLAQAIGKMAGQSNIVPQSASYVIDGGSLLHRITWKQGLTYSGICKTYVKYVKDRYGAATVVFDGYGSPNTKDSTHTRCGQGLMDANMAFTPDMKFHSKKDRFLRNAVNKQRFINLLSATLEEDGCKTVHAVGDADFLIMKTAIEYASSRNTIVIGEDTDILVLLCHHADPDSYDIFFQSEVKTNL